MQNLFKWLFFIPFLFVTVNLSAQEITDPEEKNDSTNFSLLNSGKSSISEFQNTYLLESELEHQKLLRNIFAISFVFLFAALMFIIFYYGSKVKKINELIQIQNEYMNSAKDQLQKVIAVFNYIDQLIFITGSKGIIEWTNSFAMKVFEDDYEKNKISLIDKFSTENQGEIFKAINSNQTVIFDDHIFENNNNWKMIPISNSKGEFSNMVFVGY